MRLALLRRVPLLVRGQLSLHGERLAAMLAHKGRLPRVLVQVVLQRTASPELGAALVADVAFELLRVHGGVVPEVRLLPELPAALLTFEWLVPGVRSHVDVQCGLADHRLATLFARKRFILLHILVSVLVLGKAGTQAETLTAHLARVWFLTGVLPYVKLESVPCLEMIITQLTFIFLLPCMHKFMSPEMGILLKSFATLFTFIGPLLLDALGFSRRLGSGSLDANYWPPFQTGGISCIGPRRAADTSVECPRSSCQTNHLEN